MRAEVVRDAFNPISYPELEVLRHVHGDDAVLDVVVIAEVDQSAREEKERLQLKYGAAVVEDVFPGKNPQMELRAPKVNLDPDVVWRNPLDKEVAGYDRDPTVVKEDGDGDKAKAKTKAAPKVLDEPQLI